MNADRIKNYVAQHDHDKHVRPKIVADGEIVVVYDQGRIFLYSRMTGYAYEVVPNPDTGVMVQAI